MTLKFPEKDYLTEFAKSRVVHTLTAIVFQPSWFKPKAVSLVSFLEYFP